MSLDKAFSLIQDSGGGASSKGKVLTIDYILLTIDN